MAPDVLHATGITATAGIGTNLYLAKVAMDIVAKHEDADENGVRVVRRVNIAAINVIPDSEARRIQAAHQEKQALGQMDLFTDYAQQDAEQKEQQNDLERERRLQEAVLTIKDKFGRNAVLKGTNFLEGARSRERHNEVGGHKA